MMGTLVFHQWQASRAGFEVSLFAHGKHLIEHLAQNYSGIDVYDLVP